VQFYTENGRFALSSLLGFRGNVYDVHLKLIGKRVVEILLVFRACERSGAGEKAALRSSLIL